MGLVFPFVLAETLLPTKDLMLLKRKETLLEAVQCYSMHVTLEGIRQLISDIDSGHMEFRNIGSRLA
jgi:hypothetical protein